MIFVKTFQTHLDSFWAPRTIVVDFVITTLLTSKYIFTLFTEHFEDEKITDVRLTSMLFTK